MLPWKRRHPLVNVVALVVLTWAVLMLAAILLSPLLMLTRGQ